MERYSKYLKKKQLAIFLFHGVIDFNNFKIRNYTKKHLLKDEFIDVLDDLKNNKGVCISLDKASKIIKNKKNFENYSYCITFDDGFYNNYKIAAPILIKKKLSATFYLTTNFIDKNEMSWIDKIEHIVENLREEKIVNLFNKRFKIKNNTKSKISFLKSIRAIAKKDKVNLNELVLTIKKQTGYKKKLTNLNNIIDKKMNWEHVKKLNKIKNFSIGGHTVNHEILSFLNHKNSKKEIHDSIDIIKKKLKTEIHHFSYPEGLRHTYGLREIKILKKKGIKLCPSAEFGTNNSRSNLFNLKRIFVNK